MGPHPWGDGETRQSEDVDDTPWNLLSSAVMNYSDEERTQIELELYYGKSFPMSDMYLLVERKSRTPLTMLPRPRNIGVLMMRMHCAVTSTAT